MKHEHTCENCHERFECAAEDRDQMVFLCPPCREEAGLK